MVESSFLFREIHEQPAVLEKLLREAKGEINKLAAEIQRREVVHIMIAARGTSDNAARYAQYVLGSLNGLPVGLATPSLFSVYGRPPRLKCALVLGISQSGASPDIVAVLAEARRQGALTAVLTNNPQSELAREGEFVVDLGTGDERAVAATKSYTAELVAIALLSACLSRRTTQQNDLNCVPEAVEETLGMAVEIASLAPRYRYMDRAAVIGRGYNYATAFELSLKLKEMTYATVEPYSSADFLHGPLAMVERGFPVMVIAPTGRMLSEMKDLVATLSERAAEVIAISDDPGLLAEVRVPLRLPQPVAEWLSPITAIVPGQLLAMYLAQAKGYDLDAPRGLSKVTKTI